MIRNITFSVVILLLLLMPPLSVLAAEKDRFSIESRSDRSSIIAEAAQTETACYESPKYFVIAKEVRGRPGSDFLIKYKSGPDDTFPCDYMFGKTDLEIKNEWAEYFAGLKGDLLILDSTTGPGPSGLTIWNLIKRMKVFEGTWSDPEESGDNVLIYWQETENADDTNCPELKEWRSLGLEGAVETKVILNLSDFRISRTEVKRCSPRQ